jgi:hypothetical protein
MNEIGMVGIDRRLAAVIPSLSRRATQLLGASSLRLVGMT